MSLCVCVRVCVRACVPVYVCSWHRLVSVDGKLSERSRIAELKYCSLRLFDLFYGSWFDCPLQQLFSGMTGRLRVVTTAARTVATCAWRLCVCVSVCLSVCLYVCVCL